MNNDQASHFARDFWDHLETRLRNLCTAEARCLIAGVQDYGQAFASVWAYARRFGVLHLCDEDRDAIHDWISQCLLTEAIRADIEGWAGWPHTHPQGDIHEQG